MAQNKVQYQRGLPMLEFLDSYGCERRCEEAVRSWRWPQGFVCPRCQSTWHSEFRRGIPCLRHSPRTFHGALRLAAQTTDLSS